MRIKDVPVDAEVNLWLKDSYACKLQLDKNRIPSYYTLVSSNSLDYKSFVGKIVTNDTDKLELILNATPMGVFYTARSEVYTGLATIPYQFIKSLRVLSPVSYYPPRSRYNSNRTLADGLTYRTAEFVVLAW